MPIKFYFSNRGLMVITDYLVRLSLFLEVYIYIYIYIYIYRNKYFCSELLKVD